MNDVGFAQLSALVLSNSVLAALLSISGNHLLAKLQFKRDYFKELIAKRLHAYQLVDEIVGILRWVTYDDAARIAHVVFMNAAVHERVNSLNATAVGLAMYLSEDVRASLSELNFLLLQLPDKATESEAFSITATHRDALLTVRLQLERAVAADLLTLYKVGRFLRSKRRSSTEPQKFPQVLPQHGAFSFKGEKGRSP